MNQKFCSDRKPGTKKTYYHKITQRKLLKTSKTLSFSLIQKRYLYLSNLNLGFIHFKKLFHEKTFHLFFNDFPVHIRCHGATNHTGKRKE